jgi:hypothetical protein
MLFQEFGLDPGKQHHSSTWIQVSEYATIRPDDYWKIGSKDNFRVTDIWSYVRERHCTE